MSLRFQAAERMNFIAKVWGALLKSDLRRQKRSSRTIERMKPPRDV
ncbi:hypothetical protein [Paenibacillus sp. yr247]|nr:hypothetical protein [Paenibacillus sp. yr247]